MDKLLGKTLFYILVVLILYFIANPPLGSWSAEIYECFCAESLSCISNKFLQSHLRNVLEHRWGVPLEEYGLGKGREN